MTLNTDDKCDCSANCDPMVEVAELIKTIEDEKDVAKIAETTHKCLVLMSLNDACEFMVKFQYPITLENILKFQNIAKEIYFVRLNIMKELIFN